MSLHTPEHWIDDLVGIVRGAGEAILEWYGGTAGVVMKEDRTPLTEADRSAHRYIHRELTRLTPSLPVLSEESAEEEIAGRAGWERFWLVDPLDGTKEFLKGTGEFTVNVALVERGEVRMGFVHLPALGKTYRAAPSIGAEIAEGSGTFRSIRARPFNAEAPILVASRDHQGPEVEALAKVLGPRVEFASMGSSLKFCLLAEGKADLYLRDLPTMEWDTGAAQCIVQEAGGAVYAWPTGHRALSDGSSGKRELMTPLRYNKTSLRNPGFLAAGDPQGSWRRQVEDLLDRR